MFINYELQAIFFHNTKCAGNYILKNFIDKTDFYEYCTEEHVNYNEFVDNVNEITDIKDKHTITKLGKYRYFYSHQYADKTYFDNFFKFIFIRNPYTRLVSAYLYLKDKLEPYDNTIRGLKENPEYFTSFDTFIKNWKNVNNISFFHAFICQYDNVIDFSNNCNFQYIGKIETLEYDLYNILSLLNCSNIVLNNEKVNNSIYDKHILSYYNEETFQFVNNFFKKDFEIFKYKMYDSFEEFKQSFTKIEQEVNKTPRAKKSIPGFFREISSKITKRREIIDNQRIPRIIIQTYKHRYLHPVILNNINRILINNPTYDYYFITDDDVIDLILTHFDENILNAYKKLTVGAAKGDFIRYIALYIYGGVYLDLDSSIERNLDEFIPPNNEYVFLYEASRGTITNWCIMITPRHIIMKKIIDEMVKRIHMNTETNILIVTGPKLITDVIYNHFTNDNKYNTCSNVELDIVLQLIINENKISRRFFETWQLRKQNVLKFKFDEFREDMLYYDELKYDQIYNMNIFCNNIHLFTDSTDCSENYTFNSLVSYDKIFDEYKEISNILSNELGSLTKFNKKYIDECNNKLDELHTKYLKRRDSKILFFNTVMTTLFQINKQNILNNIYICDKCSFKSYNETAYYSHDYFCKNNL